MKMFFRMFWMFWIFQIFWIYQIFRMFLNIFEIDFWNTSKYIKNLISSLFLSLRFWREKKFMKKFMFDHPPTTLYEFSLWIFFMNFPLRISSTNFLWKQKKFFKTLEILKFWKKNFCKKFFWKKNNKIKKKKF